VISLQPGSNRAWN